MEIEEDKWVHDSSLNYKAELPLRSSTGVWKSSLFIIPIEFSERLSYFGLATNLISYLTHVLGKDLKTAAKDVNYWAGVTTMAPLIGAFLADSYTGRFTMVLFSSSIYVMGLSLITLSQSIPSLKPCNKVPCKKPRKIHQVIFFVALYMVSLGTGGHKPCLESFGADQFDDNHDQERRKKMSFFNLWNFALCGGLLLGVTLIVYLQDAKGWLYAALLLTIAMAVTLIIFYCGRPYYRYQVPGGSRLIPLLQVMVAAFRKRNLSSPSDASLLYQVSSSDRRRLLCHTNRLRFLDKAAIIVEKEETQNPWRLATVTKVEELKLVVSTIPIWLTSLPIGICVAQSLTFYVKQAATMNRKINNFDVPPASVSSINAMANIIAIVAYEKIIVPILRKVTKGERGIKILQRIGIGMVFVNLSLVISALVERKRLSVVEKDRMSVLWLAPQHVMLGIGEGFALVGLQEYFYEQVPDSMRSLGLAFYCSVLGVGSFISSFMIILVDHVTGKRGNSWIGKDLNSSRLDYFYWFLAGFNGLNLCLYVFFARRFTYKEVERKVSLSDSHDNDVI